MRNLRNIPRKCHNERRDASTPVESLCEARDAASEPMAAWQRPDEPSKRFRGTTPRNAA
jgi:hypothetical protein